MARYCGLDGDTRNELANRVPTNNRKAAWAMNPTDPAAQNLTVIAITKMLRVMSSQPMTISDELAASWTRAQPHKKTAAMQNADACDKHACF